MIWKYTRDFKEYFAPRYLTSCNLANECTYIIVDAVPNVLQSRKVEGQEEMKYTKLF